MPAYIESLGQPSDIKCSSVPTKDPNDQYFSTSSDNIMNGMGLSLSEICCLFCCPPCPSRIAPKLAFLPPEPTYSFQVCSLVLPLLKPVEQSYSERGKYSLTGSDFHRAWPAPLSSRDRKFLLHTSGCLAVCKMGVFSTGFAYDSSLCAASHYSPEQELQLGGAFRNLIGFCVCDRFSFDNHNLPPTN